MKTKEELTQEYFNASRDEVGPEVFDQHVDYVAAVQMDARQDLEAELTELRYWKRSMMEVEGSWNEQEIGHYLKMPLGLSIKENLLAYIKQAELAAWKQGMTDAAQTVQSAPSYLQRHLLVRALCDARDQRTSI